MQHIEYDVYQAFFARSKHIERYREYTRLIGLNNFSSQMAEVHRRQIYHREQCRRLTYSAMNSFHN